mgnify:CR=1 FL=1
MSFLAITWDPSIGIDLGFFTIRWYSLMFVAAFLLGLRALLPAICYSWLFMLNLLSNEKGVTSRSRHKIRKIAASFLLAMTASFMLSLYVTAIGNKNSCHREERSDLKENKP